MALVTDGVSLEEFFGQRVHDSLDDLDLPDRGAADHLTGLLVRLARAERLSPTGVGGPVVEGITDAFDQIHRAWRMDGGGFDPAREVELRRALADYALFTSGFFWERVRDASMSRYFARVGRQSYRFVAGHERTQSRARGRLYGTLAEMFERYAGALTYLREVYLDSDFAPWPHPAYVRVLRW
jgi:hypothetical protein